MNAAAKPALTRLLTFLRRLFGVSAGGFIVHPERLALSGAVRAANHRNLLEKD